MNIKNTIGKGILFVLILCICISTVFAFSGSGSGTHVDPYVITTASQFMEINQSPLSAYVLGNDIDFTGINDWYGVGNWDTYTGCFEGDLDGQGYAIQNLHQTGNAGAVAQAPAVISCYFGGNITNLRIVNHTISTTNTDLSGSLIAWADVGANVVTSVYIDNITIENFVDESDSQEIGIIIGYGTGFTDQPVIHISNIDATYNIYQNGTYIDASGLADVMQIFTSTSYDFILHNISLIGNVTLKSSFTGHTFCAGIDDLFYGNLSIQNVKLDVGLIEQSGTHTFSESDGLICSNNLLGFEGTVGDSTISDVVIDMRGFNAYNPHPVGILSTSVVTCSDTYYIENENTDYNTTGMCSGQITAVDDSIANLESSYSGLDFTNVWTMDDEPYLSAYFTPAVVEPHIPYTFDDIKYFWNFEGDTPLLDSINNEPLTDYGADYLENDPRCVANSSCYEIGFSEGYLKHETGTRIVGYEKLTMCVQNNYEDDNLFSPIFDSVNGAGGGRYWSILWSSPDIMRWGVNSGNGDISMGNINELGNYHWCTTMDNETDTICGYRDGVLLGCDPTTINDAWSSWGSGTTTTNIGKITGSNNYAEATFDNLLIIGAILNDTEIATLYANDGVPTVIYDPFILYVRDNQTNALIQNVNVSLGNGWFVDTDGIIETDIIDGRTLDVVSANKQYYFQNSAVNVSTTSEFTLYLQQFPQDQPSQNETDWFDGWDFDKAFVGLSSCPLDNGETDRDFFKWMIMGAIVLFVIAYVIDHSIIGLISGALTIYLGFLMVGCSAVIGGFMIVLAFVMIYYSATKLSINGSDDFHK